MNNLFSVTQVAYILKVHPLTVRRYIKEQKLKAIKVGGNVRIRETDLADFNKDFVPTKPVNGMFKEKKITVRTFSNIDPIFQLQGRGASLELDNK